MTRTDRELIEDALDHIELLHRHMRRGDLADNTVADAVSLRLAAAIEALSRCSTEMRTRLFGDEWSLMWATRNRIAHGYAFVSIDVITSTVNDDVPRLEARLRLEVADTQAP